MLFRNLKNLYCSAGTDFLYKNDDRKLNFDSGVPVHIGMVFFHSSVFNKVNRVGLTQIFSKGRNLDKDSNMETKKGKYVLRKRGETQYQNYLKNLSPDKKYRCCCQYLTCFFTD